MTSLLQSQLLLLTQWLLQTPTKTQTWVGHFATWPATNLASLFVMWPDTKERSIPQFTNVIQKGVKNEHPKYNLRTFNEYFVG